jgi:mRNA interferase MazF
MDQMNAVLSTVVVCPLTTKLHSQWRSRIQVACGGRAAEIAVDQIRAISKNRLLQRVDQLSEEKTMELRALISEMYGE